MELDLFSAVLENIVYFSSRCPLVIDFARAILLVQTVKNYKLLKLTEKCKYYIRI